MELAGRPLPPVIVLRLARQPHQPSVVLRQILLLQVLVGRLVAVDLFAPQLLNQPILMRAVVALHPSLGVSCQLRRNVTLKDNDSESFILIIPGTDANLNC